MTDDSDHAEESYDEAPAPLDLVGLELKVRYCSQMGHDGQSDLIREIAQHGSAALPVLPSVVAQYRSGNLKVAVSALIDLWVKTGHSPILAALLEKNALQTCDIFKKCLLLERGVSDVEAEVREYLWQNWQRVIEPGRVQAVETLGRCGGRAALEMLQFIRSQMAGQVQEQIARRSLEERTTSSILEEASKVSELEANSAFLEATRDAIRQIEARGI